MAMSRKGCNSTGGNGCIATPASNAGVNGG